jgi:hypothetical protein
MAAINPDAHHAGLQFLPEKCVTALFSSTTAALAALEQLRAGGFAESQLQAYLGERGAEQLDVEGEHVTFMEKILQALPHVLAYDAIYLDEANAVLKRGGALVSVDTGDDEPVVRRAASILKFAGGNVVQHWGQWRTEQF